MAQRTLAFQVVDNVLVLVHTQENPDHAEFDAYAAAASQVAPTLKAVFVSTEGGAPNAAQRKQIDRSITKLAPKSIHTSVVTPSSAARLVVNLIGMTTGVNIRSFSPADVDEALAYCALSAVEAAHVRAALASLKRELGIVSS